MLHIIGGVEGSRSSEKAPQIPATDITTSRSIGSSSDVLVWTAPNGSWTYWLICVGGGERGEIEIRDGKGAKDRRVMLPNRINAALQRQISTVTGLHEQDRRKGGGWAQLPGALHRKDPRAGYDIGWQFLFLSSRWSSDPATGRKGRQGGPGLRTGVMLIERGV